MEGKLPEVRLSNTPFQVVSPYEPAGDQPKAIAELAHGIEEGMRYQTLLGVTGSGKTFTMAKTIEAAQKPTLVLAPNKTLAAQLTSELKEFFPNNSVVYFVSYYDYYQPEAYVPSSDTFIEKDASINEEVEKLRHAATSALLSRRDCIVVASVSCIYGIGSPMDYAGLAVFLDKEKPAERDDVIHELIDIQYDRNDYELKRGTFRVRGDSLDVFPPYADNPIRVEFWGDEVEISLRSTTSRARFSTNTRRFPFGLLPTMLPHVRNLIGRSAPSKMSCASDCSSSRRKASCSKRSAWRCARITTWR